MKHNCRMVLRSDAGRRRHSEVNILRATSGRRRTPPEERKDYAANPVKLANNKIFANLTDDSTARGNVLYLEAEQCNTTTALMKAGVLSEDLHAVTADEGDYVKIRARYPRLRVDHAELSDVLARCIGLRSAWLDYCSEPYGAGGRSPPRDIARAVALLARHATRGRTATLAITAAGSRLPPGRLAAIRKEILAIDWIEDLAPGPRDTAPMEATPFLTEVVHRAADAVGVTATSVANVQYRSAGTAGLSMTFVAFRIASD